MQVWEKKKKVPLKFVSNVFNPKTLSTNNLQYEKKNSNQNGQKSHNFEKKQTYLKCKVFIKATTNQQPLTKLQFIKQRKVKVIPTIERGKQHNEQLQ